MSSVAQNPLLTAEEELALGRLVKEGTPAERRAAIERFMLCNQKLVYSVARRNLFRASTMSLADLVQEGNVGLHRAAEKFDYARGFRFTTYATTWIIQAIRRGVESKDKTIRVPPYMHATAHRLRALRKELGRDPTLEEAVDYGIPENAFKGLDRWMETTMSLDAPIGDEDGARLHDVIKSEADSAQDELEDGHLAQTLNKALDSLNDHERRVLEMRYGLSGGDPMSLEAIGQILGVSREWIRRSEQKALWRLGKRHPELAEWLAA